MKIQQLKESVLTEAFSPSMPKWLKDRFQMELARAENKRPKTGYPRKQRDYSSEDTALRAANNVNPYQPIARNASRDYSGHNLWDAARARNINLISGKFIEGPVPQNARDERLKDPNIAFISLRNGNRWEVYSPQLNPNAESEVIPGQRAFKYSNIKQMLPYMDAFCYIDMSDPENTADTQAKADARGNLYRSLDQDYMRGNSKFNPLSKLWELGDDPRYKRYGGDDPSWAKLDKSGFSKISNGRRYAQELKKFGDKKLARKIEAFYNDLQTLFSQLPAVFSSLELNDFDWDIRNNFQSGLGALYNARTSYQAAIDRLDSFKQEPGNTRWLDRAQENLDDGKRYLDQAKQVFGGYLPAVVDWDTDDVEWVD